MSVPKGSSPEDAAASEPEGGQTRRTQRRDPDHFPPWGVAVPLGIQHVLAMFVSNLTPAIIVAGAAGFGYGAADLSDLLYMIQMSMLFAGVATLMQTIGLGPMGARLPLVQGTSFAFIPIMIPLVEGQGSGAMGAVAAGAFIGGLFHASLSAIVGRVRFALPPLVTGLVIAMIALSLIPVGIQYAAGGVPARGTPEFGAWESWLIAGVVIASTLALNFFARGIWATASVLWGVLAGYALALAMGRVDLTPISQADWVIAPRFAPFGFDLGVVAIAAFSMMCLVSAIETIGAVTGVAQGGAGREPTTRELKGATMADGVGTALAALFGALPNTSFSQNVGLVAMTGVMSRHVVTVGAVVLIICGLAPKIGAAVLTIPLEVLGGGVIIMFGMVAAAAVSILSTVEWSQRNMLVFAVALSLGLGLKLEPMALQHLPGPAQLFLSTGVLPAAALAIVLNLVLPKTSGGSA